MMHPDRLSRLKKNRPDTGFSGRVQSCIVNRTKHTRLNTILGSIALQLLRWTRHVCEAVWPQMKRISAPLGRIIVVLIFLPYKLTVTLRIRLKRIAVPAHGLSLHLLSHRYLLHGIVVCMMVIAIGMNLTGNEVNAQDAGERSLLYGIVASTEARTTEKQVRPELLAKNTSPVEDFALIAIPDIDVNYMDNGSDLLTDPNVPGTIVANIESHTPDEPAGPAVSRTETEEYTVQTGDSLSVIAARFGVNVGTILWANNRSENQYIRPGDTLRIPPVSGVLVTVKSGDTLLALANKYDSNIDKIIETNRLNADEGLPTGLEIVLPDGHPPTAPPPVPSYASPVPNYPKPPNANVSNVANASLIWPTSGHVITQYYGWSHTGLDIDGDYDSPIYASHDGVVTTAGWNSGGYGLQIMIKSDDGVMTRYAHSSKIFVGVGNRVKKGQVIAMVGTTGRSTGTHLHFEIYINGQRVNPLAYVR